jgi:cytochrome c oxidase subunit 4
LSEDLGNIEASWKDLSAEEQYEIHQQLRELQKKDWKELTVDEKKVRVRRET